MAGRVDELRKRLESQPGSRLFAQLAEELRKEGQLDEAIRVCRDGLERHPAYASAHMTLGRALFDKGDLAGARAEFESVVEAAPDNILAGRLLGECLEGLGDLAGARRRYETTLLLAPEDPQIVARLGAVAAAGTAPAASAPAQKASPGPATAPAVAQKAPSKPEASGGRAADDSPATMPAHTLAPTAIPDGIPGRSGPAPPPQPAPAARKAAPATGSAARRSAGIEVGGAASRTPTGKTAGTIPVGEIDRKTAESVEEESLSRTLPFGTPAPRLPGRSPVVRHQARPVTTEAVRRALDEVAARRKAEEAAQPAAPKPAPAPQEPEGELATPTLAELYVKQGFPDKAVEVYRAILERDATNESARARLQELESQLASQSTQRRAIQHSIARLERLLVAVERVRQA